MLSFGQGRFLGNSMHHIIVTFSLLSCALFFPCFNSRHLDLTNSNKLHLSMDNCSPMSLVINNAKLFQRMQSQEEQEQ